MSQAYTQFTVQQVGGQMLLPSILILGSKGIDSIEDAMADCDRLLLPIRKANSTRPREPWMTFLLAHYRKRVETAIDVQKMNRELPFGPQRIAVLAHDGKDLAG